MHIFSCLTLGFLLGRHMLASRFSILRTLPIFLVSINFEHIKAIISSSQLLILILNRFVVFLFLNPSSGLFLNPLSFKSQKEKCYTLQKFYESYAVFGEILVNYWLQLLEDWL